MFLSQYWRPELGAPQNRLGELAVRLRSAGWKVSVITAQPNYPRGRVFAGYRGWWWSSEVNDDIPITRCPLIPSRSKRTVARMACYLSFVVTSTLASLWRVKRQDLLFVESPPLFLGIAARLVAAVKRCRYVFNVSDLWPDSAVEMGWVEDGHAVAAARRLERWTYSGAEAVTGQSPSIVNALRERVAGIPVYLLTNGVDSGRFRCAPPNESWGARVRGEASDVVAVYAGLHGVAQGIEQLIRAMKLLHDRAGLRLVLIGDGAEKAALVKQAKDMALSNVVFQDAVPAAEIPGILRASDIAVIPLGFDLTGAVPSKIYEAMAAALPVIFVGGGDGRHLIEETATGICCDIGDEEGICAALRCLADDPKLRRELGSRGSAVAAERFDRDAITRGFEAFLNRLIEGRLLGESVASSATDS